MLRGRGELDGAVVLSSSTVAWMVRLAILILKVVQGCARLELMPRLPWPGEQPPPGRRVYEGRAVMKTHSILVYMENTYRASK